MTMISRKYGIRVRSRRVIPLCEDAARLALAYQMACREKEGKMEPAQQREELTFWWHCMHSDSISSTTRFSSWPSCAALSGATASTCSAWWPMDSKKSLDDCVFGFTSSAGDMSDSRTGGRPLRCGGPRGGGGGGTGRPM